nr:copia protein [Tanacetum cinerariifolium]
QDSRRKNGGYNGNKARDNSRRPTHQDDTKALVTMDGEDIDWSGYFKEDTQNFAMMAYSSNNPGSDSESVFMNKECKLENTPVNDRYAEGMHAVPPPMIGNYMPSRPDVEINYSKFTYGPKQTSVDESDAKTSENSTCESDTSVETTTSMTATVEDAPKYCTIDEEVYVIQPPGFVDPKFPNKFYKVVKALHGLHQAPRAWYATLSTFLEKSGYRRGAIDKTLFIKQDKNDIMLVQVYVDDIIFGSTKKSWCDEFKELMKNRFQMNSMGKLAYFLGLQTASTLIETQKPLVKGEEAADVDVHLYRDAYEKKLIHVLKNHTDDNVADLLMKAFDVSSQLTMLHSKELASPKQTTLGKDESNPLIVDCLLKTIWSSMHHVVAMKHWLFQSKRLLFWSTATIKKVNEVRVLALIDGNRVNIKESSLRRTLKLDDGDDDVSIPTEPSTSKSHKKYKSKKQQPIAPEVPSPETSSEHQQHSPSNDPIPNVAAKDSLIFQELMDLCTRLSNKVLDKIIQTGGVIADMDKDVEVNLEEARAKAYNLDLQHSEKVLSMQYVDEEEPAKVEEVLEVVTIAKLITEVVTTAAPTTTVAQVKSKDKGKGILIEEPKPLKRQAQIKQDEAFARQLEAELKANINWNEVIEQVKKSETQNNKVMRYQALKRKPLTKARARKNMMIYLKNMASFKMNFFKEKEEEVTVQEKEIEKEGHKREGESIEQEIAKKQKMDEEEEELKRHLQIVANNDDDVYTEATPLALKVLVVDYQIHHENNKPYYKIIRADGTHKLFLRFITLLKNFDREDLETLWKLVKEWFETIDPKNFLDDFLLNILKIMFEKPNIEASVWKDQKGRYGLAKCQRQVQSQQHLEKLLEL